ncbi:MAG: membrane protein insertion efficiency factor YidD [Phycisphaerales bacterium]|nr:membrane protein insertion efficiency factor YidD [Planctomycetota bacterium]MBL6997236.1 membrane protein insertion efficiency factor YidD [Phycisphaerales bacterium]
MKGILLAPTYLCILLVRGYQISLRPFIGGFCRFQPTCSDYAIEALHKYGAIKGCGKALWRIFRCHPWGGSGHDPP